MRSPLYFRYASTFVRQTVFISNFIALQRIEIQMSGSIFKIRCQSSLLYMNFYKYKNIILFNFAGRLLQAWWNHLLQPRSGSFKESSLFNLTVSSILFFNEFSLNQIRAELKIEFKEFELYTK